MGNYYAEFVEVNGTVIRKDTRIYIRNCSSRKRSSGTCIGSWYGKNPGSASSGQKGWGPLVLGDDRMLPYILARFQKVMNQRLKKRIVLPDDPYIQVLNTFFAKEHVFAKVRKRVDEIARFHVETPPETTKFVVFGWGSDKETASARASISSDLRRDRPDLVPFFVQQHGRGTDKTFSRHFSWPSESDRPRHTQGIPKEHFEEPLIRILKECFG